MSNIDHLDKGKAILSKERATNWDYTTGQKMAIWTRKRTARRTQKKTCH